MGPSKTYGALQECHSSESGWTRYIGSPIHGGSDEGHSEKAADDGQSDDSMVSDASSGPRHQRHGTTTLSFTHDEEDEEEERGCSSEKKGKKSMEKQKLGSMKNKQDKEVKKQTPLKAKRAISDPCPTSTKLRQSIWFGKRN